MKTNWRLSLWLFGAFVVFAIVHNAFYGLFGTEEPVFFVLAIAGAIGFIISVVYNAAAFLASGKDMKHERTAYFYGVSICIMVLGMVLNMLGIGRQGFSTFGSVGNWLLYIGFVGLIFATIRQLWKKKRIIDERMQFVAAKANRITFLALLIAAFVVIVFDGIKQITMPYHLFMSYLVSGLMLTYVVAYKILLRFH